MKFLNPAKLNGAIVLLALTQRVIAEFVDEYIIDGPAREPYIKSKITNGTFR
jgi:hypothetical protein